jgi:hypothetical protein
MPRLTNLEEDSLRRSGVIQGEQTVRVAAQGVGRRRCIAALATLLLSVVPVASKATPIEPVKITIELNKLEPTESGCRAYLLVTNASETAYPSFKIDLVIFYPDGVIGKRVALDLSPIKPSKRSMKLFDFDRMPCERIGSILVNDVLECRTADGPVTDCIAGLTLVSLTSANLIK